MGVISVFRPETDEPFTTQELYLLELLAPQATIAVRNVHLYEALELRMSELEQAQVNLVQAEKAAAIGRLATPTKSLSTTTSPAATSLLGV